MSVILRNASIKGIKNINKFTNLTFCKKELNNVQEFQDYNIKAIYGPNGSGKTALVHAFQIVKSFIGQSGYLFNDDKTKYLSELLNKSCNSIEVKLDFFSISDKEDINIYTYEVEIKSVNKDFEVAREKLAFKKSEYNKDKVIIDVKDGDIIEHSFPESVVPSFTNLLSKRSFADVFRSLIIGLDNDSKEEDEEDLINVFNQIYPLYDLISKFRVILDAKDKHTNVVSNRDETFNQMLKYRTENKEVISVVETHGYNSRLMNQKELERYKKEVERKTSFIKIFKPNIKMITIDSRVVKKSKEETLYSVNEFINYKDYKIDLELESVGIKKLINLYDSINHLAKGGILIIDELDSHINDIYLVRLIEYISNYSKGQLIFTTHNVSPMDMLKTKKNSIDFMSMNGETTSWTQVGNYSPSKLYKKGMISKLPFNLEAEDFLEVFNYDNE